MKRNHGRPHRDKAPKKRQKTAEYDRKAELVRIHFPYPSPLIPRIKTLGGRAFVKEPKSHWTCPYTIPNMQSLKEWRFGFGPILTKMVNETNSFKTLLDIEKEMDLGPLDTLAYPFQKAGIYFIESRNGRVILADQMGLGKTLQVIGWMAYTERDVFPAIVVVPASIKIKWGREFKKWAPGISFHIVTGNVTDKSLPKADVYIINYDILPMAVDKPCTACKGKGKTKWVDAIVSCPVCLGTGVDGVTIKCRDDLFQIKPKTLVVDEAHYIKSFKAQRTKAVKHIAKNCRHILTMSGTPIVNRPAEFFNAMQLVAPERFPHWVQFTKRYCERKHTGFGWDVSGADNLEELHDILTSTIMIRRRKREVLSELPPKIRSVVPIPMANSKRYRKAEADHLAYLSEVLTEEGLSPQQVEKRIAKTARARDLTRWEVLKQIAVEEKMTAIVQWVRDYLENENKLVIFTTHQKVIDTLAKELADHRPVILDGRTPSSKRQKVVDQFQNNDYTRLFLGNVKAAGVGIDLTVASATCFVELGWSPGDHDQAEDRIDRIGQDTSLDCVMAYYLVAEDTIEEDIAYLIDEKRKVLDQVLDGKKPEKIELLTELIRRVRKRQEVE